MTGNRFAEELKAMFFIYSIPTGHARLSKEPSSHVGKQMKWLDFHETSAPTRS